MELASPSWADKDIMLDNGDMEGDTFTEEAAVGDDVPKVPGTMGLVCMEGTRGLWLPGLV